MAKLIGTAGHVDHGKTTLIRALTGIDADRLPEEKERGMTIDIGFAYIDLPSVGRVSIVDVPGHERFLSNMLVGALGIDVALLCVAADESVKPQTREHLEILSLLPVDRLVVAFTRADLADAEQREFAALEAAELLASTRFGQAPSVFVSATTGEGLDQLREALVAALSAEQEEEKGPWYLPIDRVFSVKGHGCVVTGTLARGEVKVDEAAFLEPGHREVRVRSIHSHDEELAVGEHGRRIALNLGGIKVEEVERGQALGAPGALFETRCMDARVTWLQPVDHGLRVRVSIGAAEVLGKAFLSDSDPDLVQLRLEKPVAAALHQPLVVRRHSPPDLLCGGRVVVPQAKVRRRSESAATVTARDEGGAILEVVGASPAGVLTDEICRMLGKTPQALGDAFQSLLEKGTILGFAGLWFSPASFEGATQLFLAALGKLHAAQPMTSWHPREKVAAEAKLQWEGKPLDRIVSSLVEAGSLQAGPAGIRLPNFQLRLTDRQRAFLDRVIAEIAKEPVNTPNAHQLSLALHVPRQAVDEVLKLGVQAGEIYEFEGGVLYAPAQLAAIKDQLAAKFEKKPFAASEARDALGTSRKYIIPLLEHFDRHRVTLRVGDNRVLV